MRKVTKHGNECRSGYSCECADTVISYEHSDSEERYKNTWLYRKYYTFMDMMPGAKGLIPHELAHIG